MSVLILEDVNKGRWNEIIKLGDYNDVFMSYEWCQVAKNLYDMNPVYFILQEANMDVGAFVVFTSGGKTILKKIQSKLFKKATVYSGPTILHPNKEEGFSLLLDAWENYAKEHNVIDISWNMFTKWENKESFIQKGYTPVKYATYILRLDDKTEDDLFKKLRKEKRKSIKKAYESDVEIKRYSGEEALPFLKRFHSLFEKTYLRAKVSGGSIGWKSLDLMEEVFKQFKDNSYLFIANYNGKMAAGATIIRLNNTINYNPVGASDVKLTRLSGAADLLHWEIIRWAKREGLKFYDFGGASPNDLSHGVTVFKGGFGGDYKVFYGGSKIYSPIKKKVIEKLIYPIYCLLNRPTHNTISITGKKKTSFWYVIFDSKIYIQNSFNFTKCGNFKNFTKHILSRDIVINRKSQHSVYLMKQLKLINYEKEIDLFNILSPRGIIIKDLIKQSVLNYIFKYDTNSEITIGEFDKIKVTDYYQNFVEAFNKLEQVYRRCVTCLQNIAIQSEDYEIIIQVTKENYEENKTDIAKLTEILKKPILVEVDDSSSFHVEIKIDFYYYNELSNILISLSTIQIEQISYNQNNRYMLIYYPIGQINRCITVLVENAYSEMKKEKMPMLPVFLSPIQVRIIPIAQRHLEYAREIAMQLKCRVDIDDHDEALNKKIRAAGHEWIPYVIVIGDNEIKENKINVNLRSESKLKKQMKIMMTVDDLQNKITNETKNAEALNKVQAFSESLK